MYKHSMSTADSANNNKDDIPDVCANCGKGEESTSDLKKCAACLSVKYCCRDCQIAHRPQHKKECKRRAAELHEEALFKEVEPEDCPVCIVRLPLLETGSTYMSCCGKVICSGCAYAPVYDDKGNRIRERTCPFCRTPAPASDEETVNRLKKRADGGDAESICMMGCYYGNGHYGFPQDYSKTLELWRRAAELGHAEACSKIGSAYYHGKGVERD